jgi:DNA-binding MarR family transcriptional regulator
MTQARTTSAEQTLPVVVAMHRLLRGLRRAGSTHSVPPTQLIVLALLNQHGPLRIGELATRIPCSQPTATNGRAIQVVPTEEGLGTLRSIALGEAEALAELLASIPAEDREAFLAAAPVIGRLADRPNAALD